MFFSKYNLPFKVGLTFEASQGFNGDFTHHGDYSFSVDLKVPEGTEVYPARPGIVVEVEDAYRDGGIEGRFKNKDNYVFIVHRDSTVARYLHLRHKGVTVKVGQKVGRKTLIGFSGNTGYSSEPHLHFDVSSPVSGFRGKSLEFYFTDNSGNKFTTIPGETYTVDR